MAEKVSNKPWGDIKESDYDLEQWHRACLIHLHDGPPTSKEQCKLPVREPDGTLNANGIVAAAIRIYQVKAPRELVRKAARRLVALYKEILEREPPEGLVKLAGMKPKQSE
jgi:hypothetical protein